MFQDQLAINGGSKICAEPLTPWPIYEDDEIAAVTEVLRSGKVNYWGGEKCNEFEKKFSKLCGCKYGVAVANGTVSLELALKSIGIKPQDEVIVTSRSFFASVSSIIVSGATPIFCDVDGDSGNITADTIAPKITPRTKAVIVVHLAGWPCDMDPIMQLAEENGLLVIEDCAQAHGATYKGRPIGSIGHIGSFSFCQDKIMSTGGEGGMLVTNNEKYWSKAWSYKDHGRGYDKVFNYDHPDGFRWLAEGFGTNWRLTEMQATIGLCQLEKLKIWLKLRKRNADILTECFTEFSAFRTPEPATDITHVYYKYYTYIVPENLNKGWDRGKVREALRAEGIPVIDGTCSEIYLENAFNGPESYRPEKYLTIARSLGETSFMFPVHHTLKVEEMNTMCNAIKKVMNIANK
jgi:dTDP-4-amino-4,6-dideoxygalactose transaminase